MTRTHVRGAGTASPSVAMRSGTVGDWRRSSISEAGSATTGSMTVAGSLIVKTLPSPGTLCTVTSPLIIWQKVRVNASPRPAAELPRRRRVGLREGLKEAHDLVGSEADAGVGDAEDDPVVAVHEVTFRFDLDVAVVRELRRVRDEIEQSLPHFAQIGSHDADVLRADDLQFVAVLGNLD